MADSQLLYWVVVRDGRGKWVVVYDPTSKMRDGKRFAFQAYADEYKKKMTKKDDAARKAMAEKQGELK